MKVYINNYKDHWISPITMVEYMFFWTEWSKCGRNYRIVKDEDFVDMPKWAEKLSGYLLPISNTIKFVWDLFDRKINYVKIDRWDTWSMDHTLSYIILPMLKQLHETKHGSPFVDDEDVPEELKSTSAPPKENEWDTDGNHFKRWDYVLDEMIWAFEQQLKDDDEHQFFDHSEYDKEQQGVNKWLDDLSGGRSKVKVDVEGLELHQKRKSNGFRLFGKYYQALWD